MERDIWVQISSSGRLVFITFSRHSPEVQWWFIRDLERMSSILNYEYGKITVKTLTGEIKTLPLEISLCLGLISSGEVVRCQDPARYKSNNKCVRLIKEKYGFIVSSSKVILFAQIKEYFTMNAAIILADGTKIDYDEITSLNVKNMSEYYCTKGKLQPIECLNIDNPIIIDKYVVLESASHEFYAIEWPFTVKAGGTLLACEDSAVVFYKNNALMGRRIYTNFTGIAPDICIINKHLNILQLLKNDTPIDIPDVVDVNQINEAITLTFKDGKISKFTLDEINEHKLDKTRELIQNPNDALYYVGDKIIDVRYRFYDDQLFNINGIYCDQHLVPYRVLPEYKVSARDGVLIQISHIDKIGETYLINSQYAVLSKYAMEISDIDINTSDLFPLSITTKSGKELHAALFRGKTLNLADMCVVFENGDNWPIVGQDGIMYSAHGTYSPVPKEEISRFGNRAPAGDITRYDCMVQIIRDNYVLFSGLNETFDKIYESFGNFMVITDQAIYIGRITIHKQHKKTKPAVELESR